jgi:hypothetical protein
MNHPHFAKAVRLLTSRSLSSDKLHLRRKQSIYKRRARLIKLLVLSFGFAATGSFEAGLAADIEKGNGGTSLATAANWTGDFAPTAADNGLFDSVSSSDGAGGQSYTLGSNTTWNGIKVTTVSAPITIADSTGTWTLGGASASTNTIIDMSNASQDLTINESTFTIRMSSSTLSTYQINVQSGRTFTLNGGNLTNQTGTRTLSLLGGGNINLNAVIGGGNLSVSVNDSGGAVTLTAANTYNQTTTVTAGTLKLDNKDTITARLANSTGVTVSSGGTLLLAQSGATASTDRINDNATVGLSGGTFDTGGLNEGPMDGATGSSAAMGQLTLSVNSTIDFSTGSTSHGSNLLFASLNSTIGNTISIEDWTGTVGTDNGSASNDRILFITDPGLTDAQLASSQFYNDSGSLVGSGGTEINFNGYTEIVALSAVPEPTTIFGALALLGLVGFRERRRGATLVRVLTRLRLV